MSGLKNNNNSSPAKWILLILIILGLTLPFHWSLDYFTVFPKEHLTFSYTYFTIDDVQTVINRFNNASIIEAKSISNEPFVRKLIENSLIVKEDYIEESKINIQSNTKSSSSFNKETTAEKKQAKSANERQDYNNDDVIYMSSKDFFSEYNANQAAVDNKYKGKLLSLKGKITKVSSDYLSEGYIVSLEGGVYRSVDCYFASLYKYELSNLTKDKEVYIVGRYDGSFLSYPELKDCVIENKFDISRRRSNLIQSKYIDKANVALSTNDVIIYHKIKSEESDSIITNTINSLDFNDKVIEITNGYLDSPYGNGGWEVTGENIIETHGGIDYAKMWHVWKFKVILNSDLHFKYIEVEYCSNCDNLEEADYYTFESWEFVYN